MGHESTPSSYIRRLLRLSLQGKVLPARRRPPAQPLLIVILPFVPARFARRESRFRKVAAAQARGKNVTWVKYAA
jgi:hypothetical protein